VIVVSHDDRPFRLARRPRPEQLGDFRLVVRRARPVAVTGRVDDGDVEAAAGLLGSRREMYYLVLFFYDVYRSV
jgi:hypothetical protein